MKKFEKIALVGAAVVMSGSASAALDMSGITGAIEATAVVAAITAVAAVKILPGVATWGYNKVIGWFR